MDSIKLIHFYPSTETFIFPSISSPHHGLYALKSKAFSLQYGFNKHFPNELMISVFSI